jgi:hypothetical protein
MDINVGDIVVVGGNHESLYDFLLCITGTVNKYFADYKHSSFSNVVIENMLREYREYYMKIGRVEIINAAINELAVKFTDQALDDGYLVEWPVFQVNEVRLATEHEQFLYHVYGSDILIENKEV